jgi:hypothetical protein
MSNQIILKKSSVGAKVPVAGDLTYGELALNYADGKLYFKNSSNAINSFGSSSATETLSNKTLSNPTIDGTITSTGTGTPTLTSSTNINLTAANAVVVTSSPFRVASFTTTTRNALSSSNGDIIYNTTTGKINAYQSGSWGAVGEVSLAGTETLTNKTLAGVTITGTLIANGSAGTNGQLLASTGSGLQWVTRNNAALAALTDVSISNPIAQQVLKYNGTQWINADNDQAVASAVFATSQADLGLVTDNVLAFSEDLGFVNDIAYFIYDMGQLRLDGIVSLSNLDQSVKADYTAIAIIFGF